MKKIFEALGRTDYSTVISKIKQAKPDVVFNTLNGDSNVAFFKQLKDAGITAEDMPVLSVSIAEEEIRGIGGDVVAGHYTSWNYYQTIDTPENNKWVEQLASENFLPFASLQMSYNRKGKRKLRFRVYEEVLTQLEAMRVQLMEAKVERGKVDQAKRDWIAGISHDLKTL